MAFGLKGTAMKSLIATLLATSILAAPLLVQAQESNAPVTRAEVRADLVRLEQTGYDASRGVDATYPADIQAAEAKVAAENAQQANGGMGGVSPGTASGSRTTSEKPGTCVGPVSFCNLYAGN
jgi:hypothetical protein